MRFKRGDIVRRTGGWNNDVLKGAIGVVVRDDNGEGGIHIAYPKFPKGVYTGRDYNERHPTPAENLTDDERAFVVWMKLKLARGP